MGIQEFDPKKLEGINKAAERLEKASKSLNAVNIKIDKSGLMQIENGLKNIKAEAEQGIKFKVDDTRIKKALDFLKQTQKQPLIGKAAQASVKNIQNELKKVGITQKQINDLSKKNVLQHSELSKMEKMGVWWSQQKAKHSKTYTYTDKEGTEHAIKRTTATQKAVTATGYLANKTMQAGKSAVGMAESISGVQFSLAGIVSLLMQFMNLQDRVGAMTRQVAYQWGGGGVNKNMGTASKTMGMLMRQFWMTADKANELAQSVAKAGVEEDQMYGLTKRMTAFQIQGGPAVGEQLTNVKELSKSYGTAQKGAWDLYKGVLTTTKTIPNMSMEEVSADVQNMVALTRNYNTNLLSTVGLYNTLMRDDIAAKIGLGGTSTQLRQNLVKAAAGFNEQMSDGMKAWIASGSSAEGALGDIFAMESKSAGDQLKMVFNKVRSEFGGQGGAQGKYMMRRGLEMVLKDSGMSIGDIRALSKKVGEPGFNADAMAAEVNKNIEQLEKDQAAEKAGRKQMYADASSIAKNLLTFEQKMQVAIQNALLGGKNGNLLSTLNRFGDWIIEKLPQLLGVGLNYLNDAVILLQKLLKEKQPSMEDAEEANRSAIAAEEARVGERARGYGEFVESQFQGQTKTTGENFVTFGDVLSEIKDRLGERSANDFLSPETLKAMGPGAQTLTRPEQRQRAWSMALSQIGIDKYGQDASDEIGKLAEVMATRDKKLLMNFIKKQLAERTGVMDQVEKMTNFVDNGDD